MATRRVPSTGRRGAPSPKNTVHSPSRKSSKASTAPAVNRALPAVGEGRQRLELTVLSGAESPRLLQLEDGGQTMGAPLLPEPAGPVERFCTHMPLGDIAGGSQRQNNGVVQLISFSDLIARFDTTMGQASILLSERLKIVQARAQNATLPPEQCIEIFDIADGITAASYYCQKWAYALKTASQGHRPTRPVRADNLDEAFCSIRFALPRLMVSGGEVQKKLAELLAQLGADAAEQRARSLGILAEDLRALAPHLERFIARLGRLSSAIRPRSFYNFLVDLFTPAIGNKAAKLIADYVGR